MSFSSVPCESKNQIRKAGELLCSSEVSKNDRIQAMELANRWRACHAYPINTFQSTLRNNVKRFGKSVIVAQRLKRMPTIIDKLKRYPTMNLTTMQDIGGVRAVLRNINEVYQLAKIYKNKSRFRHEIIDERDYIQHPRDEDGYRSLHLIYRYKNPRNPDYDRLKIELQIRTRLQHTWATAVETMGTILGQALKSRRGDKEWIDYFAIISSAFAITESTSPLPKYLNSTNRQICEEIIDATKKLDAINIMKGFSTTIEYMTRKKEYAKGSFYYLLILNSTERRVYIQRFGRESMEKALNAYSEVENRAANGEQIEPVLVSAGPLNMLRRAYPNFFLNMEDFCSRITTIIQTHNLN